MDNSLFLKEFGARVRELRRINGWTQKELADRCGYTSDTSNSTINKIESGKSDISLTKLLSLAQVFDVSVSYLMGDGSSEKDRKSIAKRNVIRIMNERLSSEEKDEIIENLDIYFAERQSRKRETLNNVLSM